MKIQTGGAKGSLSKIVIAIMLAFTLFVGMFLLTACGEVEEYYILLYNEDESTPIYTEKVEAGEKIENVPTPTKVSDAEYTYTFAGWVDENGNKVNLTFATKNITAYASYTKTLREYTLNIVSNGQTLYSYDEVSIVLEDSELTSGSVVHYGELLKITVNGSQGYTVSGSVGYEGLKRTTVNGEIYYMVTGDVTISFTETANVYTVRFLDSDGTEKYSTMVSYGSSVEYPYSAPTKSSDDTGSYTFAGWVDSTDDDADYVDLTRITGSTTVYAKYNITYIEYLLTIDTNADVVVYKNGTAVSSGQTVHYGDILTIEANANEGYEISTLQANGTNITGNAFTVRGTTTITCTQTICTYNVVLYDEDKATVLFSGTIDWNSSAVVTKTPTKDTDEKYSYTFSGWVDSEGKSISSTLIISNVKADITGYATYEKEYVPYTLSLSDYVTVLLDDGTSVSSKNASNVVLNYDQTFTVSSYTVPDGYTYYDISVENATSNTEGYSVTGNVQVLLYFSKTFVADKYQELQQFAGFANENGEIIYASSVCTQKDGFMFYTYIGTEEIDLSANYVDFLDMVALNFETYSGAENTHTVSYNSTSHTWSSLASWDYTDYVTTPLYYGMTVSFIVSGAGNTDLFGLATAAQISDPASYCWSQSYDTLFVPTYNIYSASGANMGYLSSKMSGTGSGGKTLFSSDYPALYTKGAGSNYGSQVKITFVLDSYLHIYITNMDDGTTVNLDDYTSSWTISVGTAYYLTMTGTVDTRTVEICEFGYSDTLESLYLETLSGETITSLGDSITQGVGTEWDTDESASTQRYATLLAQNLGMTENNMGSSGTVYCEENPSNKASRIYDVEKIPTTSKIVTILLGTNDFGQATSEWALLGEFVETDDVSKLDTTTIYGAIQVMYSALAERFSGTDTIVYICTTVPTCEDLTSAANNKGTSTLTCGAGYTLSQLAEVEKEVATWYGLSVIDLYNDMDWDVSWFDGTKTSGDGYGNNLHPSPDGHAAMAEFLSNYIIEDNKYDYVLDLYGY